MGSSAMAVSAGASIGPDGVEHDGAGGADLIERDTCLVGVAELDRLDGHDGLPAELGGRLRHVGDAHRTRMQGERLRCDATGGDGGAEHRRGIRTIEDDAATGEDRRRVQVDLDGGDHAERTAGAAHRPEELGVVGIAQPTVPAVGGEQFDRAQRARAEPERSGEPRLPAGERERGGVHDAARARHRDEPGARERLDAPGPCEPRRRCGRCAPRRRPRAGRTRACAPAPCRRAWRMPRGRSAARRVAPRRRARR